MVTAWHVFVDGNCVACVSVWYVFVCGNCVVTVDRVTAPQGVLCQSSNWSVTTKALLMRVYWEQGSSRRMERSIKQLEVRM